MATSALSLCSQALTLIGANSIASFTEDSAESTVAAMLYKSTYHAMLTETQWHFATRTQKLARHFDTPENGWSYKFALPSDYLYVAVCSDRHYEIYERDLYCNSQDVMLEYVYPVDEVNLPAYFSKALAYNLAAQFAVPITESATKAEFYAGIYQQAVRKARYADASQRPNIPIQDSPYINARFS